MSLYQKFLIAIAIIGLVGILVLVFNPHDLSWAANAEAYWGLISMVALMLAVWVYRKSEKIEEKIKKKQTEKE